MLTVVLPFWISIALLSLIQGALVALPVRLEGRAARALPRRLEGPRRWWAIIPAGSVVGFVLLAQAAERQSTRALTYVALVGVPLGAALALALVLAFGLARGDPDLARAGTLRRVGAAAVGATAALFAVAWLARSSLVGQLAATALTALSCAALGTLLGRLTPGRWLAWGILVMAATDLALVAGNLLEGPNDALVAAHPAGGLPALQRVVLGSATMGYGDLFIAGVLGGLLAARGPRSRQVQAAWLVAALALCSDLLFFWVGELPATVPVALAMIVLWLVDRARRTRERAVRNRADAARV
ncbi:MAG: hypothetical protein FWD42_05325 [Solirubrobacterales bacterium]|nr:hypothetical protein [Solirubrobacterales bacterium]